MSHFRQTDGYGCGLYSLANLLKKESVITKTRLIESKSGNNTGQLNRWLLEDGYDFFLEPLYFSSTGKKLPSAICGIKPHGEGVISLPVLIDVQKAEEGKMHLVTGELMVDGRILITDSLKEEQELTTLAKYQKNFYRVFGLWYLRPYDGEGYYMRYES